MFFLVGLDFSEVSAQFLGVVLVAWLGVWLFSTPESGVKVGNEMDAYALGVALMTGRTEVAVHLHLLGLADGPRCVRERYSEQGLAEAIERAGVIYQAGTQRRNIANFILANQLAQSGKLGKLHTVHANTLHPATSKVWLDLTCE